MKAPWGTSPDYPGFPEEIFFGFRNLKPGKIDSLVPVEAGAGIADDLDMPWDLKYKTFYSRRNFSLITCFAIHGFVLEGPLEVFLHHARNR
jgi:hypothetical protein